MKVIRSTNTFNPVVVTITLESLEELSTFIEIVGSNKTIAKALYNSWDRSTQIADMLGAIFDEVNT
jgi:hypothetical protein